jgi:hypothetical protein
MPIQSVGWNHLVTPPRSTVSDTHAEDIAESLMGKLKHKLKKRSDMISVQVEEIRLVSWDSTSGS